MSQEKTIVELKEEDRKLLKSTIDRIEKATKMENAIVTSKMAKPVEPKHEHFTADLEYMEKKNSCPDCVKGLNDFGKEYMRKTLEERSKLPHVCKDCGMGVKPDEEKCFNCGGVDAEER